MSTSTNEDGAKGKQAPVVKQKRKNPHPVRQYFEPESATQQRCRFCNWITRENATRMVKHIAFRCKNAGHAVRIAMQASLEDAKERESNSSLTEHNKKDIHSLFLARDNDRKRECLFCGWITIVNLTRMRQHITSSCKEVPVEMRSRFVKAEPGEECSFRIVNVDGDDRREFQLVSSKSLRNMNSELDVMDDLSIENDEDEGHQEGYIVYGEVESEPDQRQDGAGLKKEPSRRQLIAQVIVDGAEMAVVEGADDEEDEEEEQEQDETENADDSVELQEQPDIEYLEVEHRECHWCRAIISGEKDDLWVNGKLFCSNECSSQEEDDHDTKREELKTKIDNQRDTAPRGTRSYSKKIMPQARSGDPSSPRKPAAQKGSDGQMQTRQALLRSNSAVPGQSAAKLAIARKTSAEAPSPRTPPPRRLPARGTQERAVATGAAYRRASVSESRQQVCYFI